jgi:hypothetical protein
VAGKRVAATLQRYPAGKFPFPDILRPEQKVALCAANKIGRLLLTGRNAHFWLFHFLNLLFSNCFALCL